MPILPRHLIDPELLEVQIDAAEHNDGSEFTGGVDGSILVRDSGVAAGGYSELEPGTAGQVVAVNGAEDGFELVTPTPANLLPGADGDVVRVAEGGAAFELADPRRTPETLLPGSEGQVLAVASGGADFELVQPLWSRVMKTADESRDGFTNPPTADAELVVPLEANQKYVLRGRIYFADFVDTAGGTIYFRMTGPAGFTLLLMERRGRTTSNAGVAANETNFGLAIAYDAANLNIDPNTGDQPRRGWLSLDVLIHNGANAGNFSFNWTCGGAVENPEVTVYAGSYIEYRKV